MKNEPAHSGRLAVAIAGVALLALLGSMAISSTTVFAAGDPVASGKLRLKVTKGFKKTLRRNDVRMRPRKFAIRPNVSEIDPTTGTGQVRLKGKLRFRGHGKKVAVRKLIVRIGGKGAGNRGGNIKGRIGSRRITLMRLRAKPQGTIVTRNGFGARISRISARLSRPLAKVVNRKLDLNSLVASRRLARLTINEQPKTVEVLGGSVLVDIPLGYLPTSALGPNQDPNTVAAKSPAHCIGPAGGVQAIEPGEKATITEPNPDVGPLPTGVAARFKFPVTSGTISPQANDGVIQVAGGVRLITGTSGIDSALFPQPAECDGETQGVGTSHSYLDTTDLAPNLEETNVLARTFIGGTSPGCTFTAPPPNCLIFGGDRGVAIGQEIDVSGIQVSADPTAKTVSVGNALIVNNSTAALVLNGLFPNAGAPSQTFIDGDKFGISSFQVNTR